MRPQEGKRFSFIQLCVGAGVALAAATPAWSQDPAPTLGQAADQVARSVCTLRLLNQYGSEQGSGTGFLVSASEIVTNWHVAVGANRIIAEFPDAVSITVDAVVGFDQASDIAVLQIQSDQAARLFAGDKMRRPLRLGFDSPSRGDGVFVVGSPRGMSGTLSTGIVSAVRTDGPIAQRIQITAPISRGSSGSPVCDLTGRVIGVVNSYLQESQSMNFATPAQAIAGTPRTPPMALSEWIAQFGPDKTSTDDESRGNPPLTKLEAARLKVADGMRAYVQGRIAEREARLKKRFPPLAQDATATEKLQRQLDASAAAMQESDNLMYEALWKDAIDLFVEFPSPPVGTVTIRNGWPFITDLVTVEVLVKMSIPEHIRMSMVSDIASEVDPARRTPELWWITQVLTFGTSALIDLHMMAKESFVAANLRSELGHACAIYEYRRFISLNGSHRLEHGVSSGAEPHVLGGETGLSLIELLIARNVVYGSIPELHSARAAILQGLANQKSYDSYCSRNGLSLEEYEPNPLVVLTKEDYAAARTMYREAARSFRLAVDLRRKRNEAAPPKNRYASHGESYSDEHSERRCLVAAGDYEQVVMLVKAECEEAERELRTHLALTSNVPTAERDESDLDFYYMLTLESHVRLLESIRDLGNQESFRVAWDKYQQIYKERDVALGASYRARPTVRLEIQRLDQRVTAIAAEFTKQ
jgi:hypothetical protein